MGIEHGQNDRGLALVSVLWGISILSLIAGAVMTSAVLSRQMERHSWSQAQADALMEAAVNRAILGLTDQRLESRWRIDGVSQTFDFQGTTITVAIEDELGKIDLNAADGDTLMRLFREAGVAEDEASALANRVLDWRSPSESSHRLDGAIADDYARAGLSYRPRGGAFQSTDELKLVLGMAPEIYARIEPAITVYSGKPFFEQLVAPREALLTLPGYDDSKVSEMITARTNGRGTRVSMPLGVVDPRASLAGRAFTIRIDLNYRGNHLKRAVLIRLTGGEQRPYLILDL